MEHAVVVGGLPTFDHAADIEPDDIHGDAHTTELFLEHRHHPLPRCHVLLMQDGEAHRRAARIFEHAVAVAIGEADPGQQLPRAGRIMRIGGDVR